MSFLGSIGSVMEDLGVKGSLEIIYTPATSTDSAVLVLISSNTTPEDFLTASFQTEDQNLCVLGTHSEGMCFD